MLIDGLNFLLKGGPVMWPLFCCAIAAVAIILERTVALENALKSGRGLAFQVRKSFLEGRERGALTMLDMRRGPVANVLRTALKNSHLDRTKLEHLIEEVAMEETPGLARGLNILDTIVTVAPLLGLLGTVTGMIKAFQVVAISSGLSAPTAITGGVAEALIATATGLAIAIVTLVGYNILSDRVKSIVSEMELAATQVVNDIESRGTVEDRRLEAAAV